MLHTMAEHPPSKTEQIAILAAKLREGGVASTTGEMLNHCLDEWHLHPMEAYKRIRSAKISHAKGVDIVDRSDEIATTLSRFENIYKGACEDRDWSAATKALMGICTMLGLKP